MYSHKFLLDELIIRPYQSSDIPSLYSAVTESKTHLAQFMSWCDANYSIEDATSWVMSRDEAWNSRVDFSFVILNKAEDTVLGGVGINFINWVHRIGNLGYWVRQSELGKNIASRATKAIIEFGFHDLNLQRLEIVVALENLASQKVAQKLKAQQEGILRKRLNLHDTNIDAIMYSLVSNGLE